MENFLEITYHQKGKDPLFNQRHTHSDSYELIQTWTENGNVLIRDAVYSMKRGCLFLIRADEIHCTNPANPVNYERSKLIVSAGYLEQLAELTGFRSFLDDIFSGTGGACFLADEQQMNAMDDIFRKMDLAAGEAGTFRTARLTSLLLLLLEQAGRQDRQTPGMPGTRLARVVDFINCNLTESIGLEDICQAADVSRYYLCHLFKQSLGMTVSQYILRRRLALAREMLIDTDKPVSEVAMACGFSSFSYFSRMFHAAEGCTPRTFRSLRQNRKIWV